ncbi:MAG: PQQ-binding-like beta-propeller repeat protein [Phycisphaerae bacterium]|nr:PQQ-binding-like beta-propeller repeat protein [Phycisphaerae bacterium]MCZ2399150.1 PQQ-binding-like beta-propeller repeat protein [Phycisphaerae bacterium]NUQ49639.1 PQQ-binding-like beta-propeller repeat protein [Phycisphaerae bacterium]
MNARTLAALAAGWLAAAWAGAGEWTAWRGPLDSGYAPVKGAVRTWDVDGKNVLWRQDFGGRSTPIVHKGRVFFNAPTGEGANLRECVVCLDADTGEPVWRNAFNVFRTDVVENRVGWPSVVVDPETGYVYCHGTGGELFCWDRDGKLIWKHSLTEEFGRVSGYGGRIMNPVVDEDLLIINFLGASWGSHARGTHRYFALDKRDGRVVWCFEVPSPPLDTTYATPVVAVVGGKRMMIAPAGDGWTYGVLVRTGQMVWKHHTTRRALNVSPVVQGDHVYICQSEENLNTTEMGSVVCLNGALAGDITATGEVWRRDGLEVGYSTPALANGRLYAVDNSANLFALDALTGETRWRYSAGRVGKGSPVVTADGVIYIGEQNGIFSILRDAGNACEPLCVYQFPRNALGVDEIFGSPAVVDGRVYFLTRYSTFCLADPAAKAQSLPLPPPQPETPDPDARIAGFLVVPAEITLSPGEKARFELRPFDTAGRFVTKAFQSPEATWTVAGPKGRIEGDTFIAAADRSYSAGLIKVKWIGDAEVSARVRVMPPLPIEETFDALPPATVPPGWNGVGGGPAKKLEVVDLDGQRVLRKNTGKERPSPPFMRLFADCTPVVAGGMTVQCDMMSELRETGRRSFQPDMGLSNTRYELILAGADKKRSQTNKLRIETWGSIPRLRHEIDFNWDPQVWYTVKFEVRPEDPRATARAKVWRRGDPEPEKWTIELADPIPNREGTAALYAYSTGTTESSDGPATYFDNLKVHRHED